MTDHKQAAIEAGDDAYGKAFVIIGTIGDVRHQAMATALDAMLPHLRAMIAQEIRDETCTCGNGSTGCKYFNAGIDHAALIAKGPQQ